MSNDVALEYAPGESIMAIISGVLIIILVALPLHGSLQLEVIGVGLILIILGIIGIIITFRHINNMRDIDENPKRKART
ncbi:MAG: hypothetical protein QXS81_01185 [Candidatus Micrarchaeaceae archaeon]